MEGLTRRAEPELMDIPREVEAYARADFAAVNQAFVERLIELAGARENANAVDLGTGPADIPIRVARARPKWRITAVDASQQMLDVAEAAIERAGLKERIKLVLADAKDAAALPGAAFDVVFSNSLLHHVGSVEKFWMAVKRIARPNALIFLRDLARPESEQRAGEIVAQYAGTESALLQEEFHRSLLAAYTVEEVRAQLRAAGLNGLDVAMASDRHLDVWGKFNTEKWRS